MTVDEAAGALKQIKRLSQYVGLAFVLDEEKLEAIGFSSEEIDEICRKSGLDN